jgi:hypothetical protein
MVALNNATGLQLILLFNIQTSLIPDYQYNKHTMLRHEFVTRRIWQANQLEAHDVIYVGQLAAFCDVWAVCIWGSGGSIVKSVQ